MFINYHFHDPLLIYSIIFYFEQISIFFIFYFSFTVAAETYVCFIWSYRWEITSWFIMGYSQGTTVASLVTYFVQKILNVYPFLLEWRNLSWKREIQYCSFTGIHIFPHLSFTCRENISKSVIWPTDTKSNLPQQLTQPSCLGEPVNLAPV